MRTELETTLRRIENHAEVARGGIYPSVYAVHSAQADLANVDVPELLELVRSLAAENEKQKKALQAVENTVKRWRDGELVNNGDGIVWREPISTLPAETDQILEVVKEGLNHEGN